MLGKGNRTKDRVDVEDRDTVLSIVRLSNGLGGILLLNALYLGLKTAEVLLIGPLDHCRNSLLVLRGVEYLPPADKGLFSPGFERYG